jgi:dethiobiotin synthetase
VTTTIETASPSFPSSLEIIKHKKLKRIQVVEISLGTLNHGESAHEE